MNARICCNIAEYTGAKEKAIMLRGAAQVLREADRWPVEAGTYYKRILLRQQSGQQNVIAAGIGEINIGDTISILQTKESLF